MTQGHSVFLTKKQINNTAWPSIRYYMDKKYYCCNHVSK